MKNKPAIINLFAANTISGFAQGLSMIAIPWYVTNILDKAALFGYMYMGVTIVSLFWGLYAGTLIDRFNRRNIFIVNSIVGCTILTLTAIAGFIMGSLPALPVTLVLCVTFLIYNIHYPNLYTFMHEIVEPEHYGRITSYLEIQNQATTAFAGVLAAILLGGTNQAGNFQMFGLELDLGFTMRSWQLHEIFALDAATYVVAIFLISRIRYTPIAERHTEVGSVVRRFKTGMQYLLSKKFIFLFGVTSTTLFVGVLVCNFYLIPIYIKKNLGQEVDAYASYEMVFAIGSLLAGVMIQRLFRNMNAVLSCTLLLLAGAGMYFVYSISAELAVFYIASFFLGMSNAGARIQRVVYFFRRVPNQVLGRVNGVLGAINVLMRITFILALTAPFFRVDKNIIYAMLIFSLFIGVAVIVNLLFYRRMVKAG